MNGLSNPSGPSSSSPSSAAGQWPSSPRPSSTTDPVVRREQPHDWRDGRGELEPASGIPLRSSAGMRAGESLTVDQHASDHRPPDQTIAVVGGTPPQNAAAARRARSSSRGRPNGLTDRARRQCSSSTPGSHRGTAIGQAGICQSRHAGGLAPSARSRGVARTRRRRCQPPSRCRRRPRRVPGRPAVPLSERHGASVRGAI